MNNVAKTKLLFFCGFIAIYGVLQAVFFEDAFSPELLISVLVAGGIATCLIKVKPADS